MNAIPEKEFQKDIEAMRADLAALVNTVSALATRTSKAEAAVSKNVKKTAKEAAGAGEDLLEEGLQLGRDAGKAAMDAPAAGLAMIENEIKRNPLNAVLIALGIGFIAGLLGRK